MVSSEPWYSSSILEAWKLISESLVSFKQAPISEICLPGTRELILERIRAWVEPSKTTLSNEADGPKRNNIMWIYGQPGSGKSTIAASIFTELDKEGRCARFFCRRNKEPDLRDPRNIWPSIARRLAELSDEIRSDLHDLVKGHRTYTQDTSLNQQYLDLIHDPLTRHYPEASSRVPVVIIDALDECDSGTDYNNLLKTLADWALLPSRFELIITSRDYPDIRDTLSGISEHIQLLTGEDVDAATSEDVERYLIKRFDDMRAGARSLAKDWPGAAKITELKSMAAGLFIWATVATDHIRGNSERRLRDLRPNWAGIDALYVQVLQQAFNDATVSEKEDLQAVLTAVAFSTTPLSTEEILDLTEPLRRSGVSEVDSIQFAAPRLQAVISKSAAGRYQVCHKSFADFLSDKKRAEIALGKDDTMKDFLDYWPSSLDLAQGCMKIMDTSLVFNICELKSSYLLNSEVPGLDRMISSNISSSLKYACLNWCSHLERLSPQYKNYQEVLELIQSVLYKHFLHWLEVLSFVGCMNRGPEFLLSLARTLHVSSILCQIPFPDKS